MMIDFSKKRVCFWCGKISIPTSDPVAVIEGIGICYPCYLALDSDIKIELVGSAWIDKLRAAIPAIPIDIEE